MSRFAACQDVAVSTPAALASKAPVKGITAKVIMAGTTVISGAIVYISLFTWPGITSSLNMNLPRSASGWSSPSGPTRFGPRRSCIHALTRRSAQTMSALRMSSTCTMASTTRMRPITQPNVTAPSAPRAKKAPRSSRIPKADSGRRP